MTWGVGPKRPEKCPWWRYRRNNGVTARRGCNEINCECQYTQFPALPCVWVRLATWPYTAACYVISTNRPCTLGTSRSSVRSARRRSALTWNSSPTWVGTRASNPSSATPATRSSSRPSRSSAMPSSTQVSGGQFFLVSNSFPSLQSSPVDGGDQETNYYLVVGQCLGLNASRFECWPPVSYPPVSYPPVSYPPKNDAAFFPRDVSVSCLLLPWSTFSWQPSAHIVLWRAAQYDISTSHTYILLRTAPTQCPHSSLKSCACNMITWVIHISYYVQLLRELCGESHVCEDEIVSDVWIRLVSVLPLCVHQSSAPRLSGHSPPCAGEKPFECTECGRRFARNTDLKVHMPVHSDDKPYKCGECEKMFTRFSTLKEHIRTHTGQFSCPRPTHRRTTRPRTTRPPTQALQGR